MTADVPCAGGGGVSVDRRRDRVRSRAKYGDITSQIGDEREYTQPEGSPVVETTCCRHRVGGRIAPLVAAALAVIAGRAALAQVTGGFNIKIIDNSDKSAIVGAAVTLSNSQGFLVPTTIVTNVKGEALFPVLRPGQVFTVDVIMDGYARIKQDIRCDAGNVKDVVIAMAPEQQERVTIIDHKTIVDLDNNEQSTKFSSEFIQDLPVAGRFYQNVLALAPGVQDPDGDGNPNVNGARERDFKATVSGVSNVDPLTGKFLNQVASDSIEAISVVTAGAGVEYGRAQGGFAQIIQKQGSNDFEGVFGMIFSSRALDGTGATGLSRNELPDFFRYQPSLQVSGPIVKDKLWYRLTQEYIKREDPVVLGSGGDVATTGTEQFSTSDQLTWQVSNRNKLALQYQADPLTTTNNGVSPLRPVSATQTVKFGGPTYSLTWTAPYSPSLLVESIAAYQDTRQQIIPTTSGVANTCIAGGSFLDDAQCTDLDTGRVSGSSGFTWKDERQRLTIRSDATYYKGRMWGMSHQFKFGFITENERYFRSLEEDPTFGALRSTVSLQDPTPERLLLVNFSLQPFSTSRAVGTTWGIYGEDVVRPISNLSVTVGLRISQEDISSAGVKPFDPASEAQKFLDAAGSGSGQDLVTLLQNGFVAYEDIPGALDSIRAQVPGITINGGGLIGQQAFWTHFRQPDNIDLHNTNLEPRFAAAWDPWNDGKTKFSVSAGRYYDKIFLAVPLSEIEPVHVSDTWTASEARGSGEVPFQPTFAVSVVDRNLKTPYQDEYSFAVEREVMQESSVSLRYIHRNFKDQLQDIDINNAPGDYGRCAYQNVPGDPYIVPSPGTGPVVDPYTGQTYQDTDPGIGDGRIDDCSGTLLIQRNDPRLGAKYDYVTRPDGIPDLYVLNPAWGHIYKIGNYNAAKYDGVILEFVRRQYKNWQMEASYTWSRAVGDGEDFNLALGNDRSLLSDEYGYQSYDRTHSVKINATAITLWGFRLGGAVQWQSGLPYSLLTNTTSPSAAPPQYNSIAQTFFTTRITYPTRQRNDQRNRSYWNVDAKLVKEMNLPKGMNLQLTAEIFNLLNDNVYIIYNPYLGYGQQLNGANDAYRRFGRQYQLGMRLAF